MTSVTPSAAPAISAVARVIPIGSPVKTMMKAPDMTQAPMAKARSPGVRPVRRVYRASTCWAMMLPTAQVAQNWLMNVAGWSGSSQLECTGNATLCDEDPRPSMARRAIIAISTGAAARSIRSEPYPALGGVFSVSCDASSARDPVRRGSSARIEAEIRKVHASSRKAQV